MRSGGLDFRYAHTYVFTSYPLLLPSPPPPKFNDLKRTCPGVSTKISRVLVHTYVQRNKISQRKEVRSTHRDHVILITSNYNFSFILHVESGLDSQEWNMHAYVFVFWNQLYARIDMIRFPGSMVYNYTYDYIHYNMKQEINPDP